MTVIEFDATSDALAECMTLTQAETRFGTPFRKGLLDSLRAKTWGWFDGFWGRPNCPPANHKDTYKAAYKEGADFYLRRLPS